MNEQTGRLARAASRLGLLSVAVAMVGGCGVTSTASSFSPSSGSSESANCPSTPAEAEFGCGPELDGSIIYQPDVVLVAGGATSVVERKSDGLSWVIRGNAPGVEQLQPGRVMVLTGLVAGRVLDVKPSGDDRMVTLGPVALGEVIRDGELAWSSPISLDNTSVFVAPDFPGTTSEGGSHDVGRVVTSPAGAGDTVPLLSVRPPSADRPLPLADSQTVEVRLGPGTDFHPYCCNTRIGADFSFNENGIKITGSMGLKLEKPSIDPRLVFKKGELIDGTIIIRGIKGFFVDLATASSPDGPPANFERDYMLPAYFTPEVRRTPDEPITAQGITEFWSVRTLFSAGTSTLDASADYDFNSDVLSARFSDRGGVLDFSLPTGFTPKVKLLDTITGLSVGVNGLDIGMSVRMCVCYGALATADGLFFQLSPAIGIRNDSSAVALLGGRCRSAEFEMVARVGNGHRLYKGFVDVMNKQLELNNASERIAPEAGFVSPLLQLWHVSDSVPAGFERCQY